MTSTLKKKTGMGWGWWGLTVLVVVVVVTSALLLVKYAGNRGEKAAPASGALIPYGTPYSPAPDPSINFTEALSLSLLFFDIQKAGRLPSNNPIEWRGNSTLTDGQDVGLDLSGGLFDAGDHVKFGLPMAYTATLLSWAVLEYRPRLQGTDQLAHALDSIRWITDFLIQASPPGEVYYFQVGDAQADHDCWVRAEDLTIPRPTYQVNSSAPGSDVAGEAAAALAAASLVFRADNASYSSILLDHATQLFEFSDRYRGSYSQSVPVVQKFYNSTSHEDELLWAAAWLYHATQDAKYLDFVTGTNGVRFANWGKTGWFSWDDKLPGVQVLLARALLLNPASNYDKATTNSLQNYKATADALVCSLLPDSPTASHQRTKGGMLCITDFNAAQHAVGAALLAVIYSSYLSTAKQDVMCSGKLFTVQRIREFAATQAAYLLGRNAMNTSYVVGYGSTFPLYVHHRGASIPSDGVIYDCSKGFDFLDAVQPNPHLTTGALVGGPFLNDSYTDYRRNSNQNEPCTYNNAALAGLLAGLSSPPSSLSATWS